MSRFFKSAAFPILIVIVLAFFARELITPGTEEQVPTYSEFRAQVEAGDVEAVTIMTEDNTIEVQPAEPGSEPYQTAYPDNTEQNLLNTLEAEGVSIEVEGLGGSAIGTILLYTLPFVLFIFLWIFLMRRMMGGGSQLMKMGKSKAKLQSPEQPKITFRDVAGVDEAVEELQEIKEFLENPKKFQALGARIPKGVLL